MNKELLKEDIDILIFELNMLSTLIYKIDDSDIDRRLHSFEYDVFKVMDGLEEGIYGSCDKRI